MIKKIRNIKNVGKFKNCCTGNGSEFDFGENTFLFGPNAKGKSTLTAIFSSLASGDPSLIIGRKSFGSTDKQEVNIDILNKNNQVLTHSYASSGGWSINYPNLVVFDTKFVAKNVYVQETVTEDNEKSIETIILGEQGRKLEKDFLETDNKCQKNSSRKAEITNEFTKHLGYFQITFKDFRNKINKDSNIDFKIARKENEIKAFSQPQKVKAKLEQLDNILNTELLESFLISLSPTISIHQDKIKKHILQHFKTNREADKFLSLGTSLLKTKNSISNRHCVFCGQILKSNAKSLIETYETLFSNSYKILNQSVQGARNFFETWKVEADLRRFASELLSMGVEISLDAKISDLKKAINIFIKEIITKNDLNYKINFTSLKQLIITIGAIKAMVTKFKTKYSVKYDENQLKVLEKEKSFLELDKRRGEKIWTDFCDEYDTLEKRTMSLTRNRETVLNAKINYAKNILSKYESEVNKVLNSLQADFRLVDTKPKESVRSTAPLFGICFGNHKIALSASREDICYFGNSLSESDKRLLAFAFFIASLKVQGSINDKIIIFDDPLSSLDSERRLMTVNLLKEFIQIEKPLQLIVLTHEKSFFSTLNDYIPNHRCFKIVYNPTKISSSIELMNPNEEFLETYYRQLEDLKKLESSPDSELNWEKLRPIRDILEQLFKKKYYFRLRQEISGKKSVSSYVKKLLSEKVYGKKSKQKIGSLIVHFWNHDDSDKVVKRDEISCGDLRGIIKNFFEVIEII